jgi:hypothetical protein
MLCEDTILICNNVLVRKSEGMRLLGRYKHRLEDNIKIYFKRISVGGCELDSSG